MKWLELRIPPPVIMAAFMLLSYLISRCQIGQISSSLLTDSIALLLLVSGIFIAVLGVLTFRRQKTTINPHKPHETSSLVSSGIYTFTRNPMYVGLTLLLIASQVYFASLSSFISTPLFMLYLSQFQIKPEEKMMEKLFAEEYLLYKKQVGRWL